jgi:hypothetical protein
MRPCQLRWVLPVLSAGLFLTGCKSTSSFFMQRFDSDRLAGSSNGELGVHDNAKPFKGIPITLKVPTHVDIFIQETIYLDANTLEPVPTSKRNLKAKANPVCSDKLFSVDPKRAAAGLSEYEIDMNNEHTDSRQRQYFKALNQKVTDETIKDITSALNTLLPGVPSNPDGGKAIVHEPVINSGLLSMDRDVAWKRFDISSPDFEIQVKAFVDEQLNSCHTCGPTCSVVMNENVMPVVE